VALLRQAAFAIAVSVAATMSAAAADWPLEPAPYPATYPLFSPRPIAQWESEIGGRYWYSVGRTEKNLFDFPGGPPIFLSRLTYTNLQAHSGEAFGRLEHLSGFFIKGFAGGGSITGGNLQDEDFPPIPGGYSSTNSDQRDGRLAYATVDLGWTWRSEGIKLGFFGGYFYNFERVNAFGCTQAAANPFICVPPIPSSVLGITQDTTWNAVRIGFNGEWRFAGGWRAGLDLAWLPWSWLNANDTHWLRPFSAPEEGTSFSNFQIEALIGYQFTNGISVAVGGRYWRINSSFGQSTIDGLTQTISLNSERWGGFLQASYKFGELRPTRY
jgi:outer membrane protease